MRVLVATTAGAGRFGPMVPFATARVDAGHGCIADEIAALPPAAAAVIYLEGLAG